MVHQETIQLKTEGHREMHDLTPEVSRIIAASGISTGFAHVFNLGSTAGIGTIEFEPGLEADLPEMLDLLISPNRSWGHDATWHDHNGHSHLQATMVGPSITVPVTDGRPALGQWQQIFHVECDIVPHERQIVVTVFGE